MLYAFHKKTDAMIAFKVVFFVLIMREDVVTYLHTWNCLAFFNCNTEEVESNCLYFLSFFFYIVVSKIIPFFSKLFVVVRDKTFLSPYNRLMRMTLKW